jgi:putative methionine-R-sulfoxide reductase with GAF domain
LNFLDSQHVERIIRSKQFQSIEKTLISYETFKTNLETTDETKLDDLYFVIKGVVNDYKSTLILLSKINKLLEVQFLFCEKVIIQDIFERLCDIISSTLECDRTTLYLVDNVRKELWSKAAKNSDSIIRLPFGKGLAGYVAESKTNLVLDDAYFDPRFNKEYDTRSGYKTKSVLCVPIFDPGTDEVIGVIQSLNKKSKINIFDVNDEITSELLSKMIGIQLKQSIEFSDYNLHETKIKTTLSSSNRFFAAYSMMDLIKISSSLISSLFTTDKIQIIINLKDFELNLKKNKDFPLILNQSFYKIYNEEVLELDESRIKLGAVGYVYKNYDICFTQSTRNCTSYNPCIDIDTSLPVVTFPVTHPLNEKLVAIIQMEYNVSRLGISDFRINKVDQLDSSILNLIGKIIAINLEKFFVSQEDYDEN